MKAREKKIIIETFTRQIARCNSVEEQTALLSCAALIAARLEEQDPYFDYDYFITSLREGRRIECKL